MGPYTDDLVGPIQVEIQIDEESGRAIVPGWGYIDLNTDSNHTSTEDN